jgi:hypothetical protein
LQLAILIVSLVWTLDADTANKIYDSYIIQARARVRAAPLLLWLRSWLYGDKAITAPIKLSEVILQVSILYLWLAGTAVLAVIWAWRRLGREIAWYQE